MIHIPRLTTRLTSRFVINAARNNEGGVPGYKHLDYTPDLFALMRRYPANTKTLHTGDHTAVQMAPAHKVRLKPMRARSASVKIFPELNASAGATGPAWGELFSSKVMVAKST